MDWGDILLDSVRVAFGPIAGIYALGAVGLNVHFGYTGLLNFGQVGFFLVGAYGAAITVDAGGPLILGVGVGVGAAVVLALLLGLPTLRLRAEYLAITTIAVAEILRLVVRSQTARPFTGGVFGILQVSDDFFAVNPFGTGSYGIAGLTYSERALWVSLVAWLAAVLATLLVWRLANSPWGRVLRGIREDEDAVRSLGKNVFSYKLQSLVLGGTFGALAGTLLMVNQDAALPDVYVPIVTFFAFTIVILGGPGTVWGPLVASVIFWFLMQFTEGFLREAILAGWIPESVLAPQEVAALRFALVGFGLMLLMIFRPQGIFGRREELMIGDG